MMRAVLRRLPLIASCLALLLACQRAPVVASPESQAPLEFLERVQGTRSTTIALPLVVAVHGLGDRPEQFAGLMEGFDRPIRLILPRGPDAYGNGSSWFEVRFNDDKRAGVRAEQVAAAADRLAAFIQKLSKERPARGKPILLGFSQGGVLSFAVAARHPDLLGAAIPLAGALPEDLWPAGKDPRGPPIVAFHGALDPLIPFDAAKQTVDALNERGFKAQLVADPKAGHELTPMLRARFFGILRGFLPATEPGSQNR